VTTQKNMTIAVHPARYTALTLKNLAANIVFLALTLVPLLVLDWQRVSAAFATAHLPNLGLIASAGPVVLIHLVAVIAAVVLSVAMLVGPKGVRLHRTLGWTWTGLMGTGALSSVFLSDIRSGAFATGGFSVFHIITAIVLIVLPLAIWAARKHRIRWHAALMIYLVVNVLLSAGLIAMYPSFSERLLPSAIFDQGADGR
jgi:uncharacterized membrane protein